MVRELRPGESVIIRGHHVKVIDIVPVEKLVGQELKCKNCGHTRKEHEVLDSVHDYCYAVIPITGGDIYCGCHNFISR